MMLELAALLLLLVVAVSMAGWAYAASRRRDRVLTRAMGRRETTVTVPLLAIDAPSRVDRLSAWIAEHLPPLGGEADRKRGDTLIHAGFTSASASVLYDVIRIATGIVVPLVAVLLAPREDGLQFGLFVGLGLAIGILAPPAVLGKIARDRQARIRKALPDSLDLVLVCVEAGVSLDAALLRVAREMELLHPELAAEFLHINRRTNAGVPRDEALRELYRRTGLEELRALASAMSQSERWGTPIGKVLRVYSETLRRQRKQRAEKQAAVAATKMILPMAALIMPALFVVLAGPAVMALLRAFDAMSR
jgi:tight adherence protein C